MDTFLRVKYLLLKEGIHEQTNQTQIHRWIQRWCSQARHRTGVRYQFIDTEKEAYPISLLCKVMQVSRSGFYSLRSRDKSKREKERDRLVPKVKAIHSQVRGCYGARRISEELTAAGESCGRAKATTLMRLAKVCAKQKKRFKATTDSKHNLPVAPNLLNRIFNVPTSDRVYYADITYLWTPRALWSWDHFIDAHVFHSISEKITIYWVPISQ